MRVISLLRSAVAGPRQRPIGALAILTVIVAVVTMHSMSGSPTSHHVPHDTSVVTAHSITTAGVTSASETRDGHAASDPAGSDGECSDGCGGHEAAMAMCLMILVAVLALVVPARRLLWRAPPEWPAPSVPTAVGVRAVAAPSLHELCISRT